VVVTAHFPNSQEALVGAIDDIETRGLYRKHAKRLFDIAFVLLASPFVLPVVGILAFLVMLDGHSPFFVQRRIGRNGKIFSMIKLRSMVPDADRRLAEHLGSNSRAREEWDRTQKLRRDPRITWIGQVIRKTSLDELPQFFNVLRGDMSVVGPRPMMPSQRELYPGQAYYLMRPGVTGLWQIGDRNNTSFASRARYDAEYYRRLGLRTDLGIILRTLKVVARGTGC